MTKIWKFLLTWHEFISVPLAILLFWFSPYLLRLIDPTAASYDAGILQKLVIALIAVFLFNGFAWFMLKINFPQVYNYFDDFFEKNLNHFTSSNGVKPLDLWQKSKLTLSLFVLYFLAFLLAFLAV